MTGNVERSDLRQVRLAIKAWREGKRDPEFWLRHIEITVGGPIPAEMPGALPSAPADEPRASGGLEHAVQFEGAHGAPKEER